MEAFNIGDKAVYPAQGVTEVLGIESKEIMGTRQDFYVLRVLDSDKKIMIPVEKVQSVGLREVMGLKEVDRVYRILKTRASRGSQGNWNRRYRAYVEKIKTGSATATVMSVFGLQRFRPTSWRRLEDGARALQLAETILPRPDPR